MVSDMWRLFKKNYEELIEILADLMEIDEHYGYVAEEQLNAIDDLMIQIWSVTRDMAIRMKGEE